MSAIPPAFKQYLSALRRADELAKESDRESRVVSYFCRLYVVIKSCPLMTKGNVEEQEFINRQFEALEKIKPSLQLGTDEENKAICFGYAQRIFDKANEIFNSNLADKSTAKLFYSAGTFFDILDQFGELSEEVQEMKKYAKWRATEIINACNNGEQPLATGELYHSSASADSLSVPPQIVSPLSSSSTTASTPSSQVAPAASGYSAPSIPPVEASAPAQSQFTPPVNIATLPPSALYPAGSIPPVPARAPTLPSDPRIRDAIELLHFSIANLKTSNFSAAKEHIFEALQRIG